LELLSLPYLKGKKNLLAFSGGVDSTALFFLLMEEGIKCDLAIVDYSVRPQSRLEVEYAQQLANKYKLKFYTTQVELSRSNFEARAREVRYNFFEKVIKENGYDNLLTAHQLDDQLDWFFMQLAKGSGLVELIGMQPRVKRDNYYLIRPLLQTSRREILEYLDQKGVIYFLDSSNEELSFWRNRIQKEFTQPFLKQYELGVKRSMKYLLQDREEILSYYSFEKIANLLVMRVQGNPFRVFDLAFKQFSYLLSTSQKEEILKQQSGVIAGEIAFGFWEGCFLVAPYVKQHLSKLEKELFRKAKIPPPLRGYLAYEKITPNEIRRRCTALGRNERRSYLPPF